MVGEEIPLQKKRRRKKRKQKRAGRATRSRGEKEGVRAGVSEVGVVQAGKERPERRGSPGPVSLTTLHSLTLLASLGGLFL